MIKEELLQKFAEIFGDNNDTKVYFAPGRVNLIGEHTDYNGGHVFPCALTIGTYAAARKRNDNKLRFYSMNFEKVGVIESSLDELTPDEKAVWTNYPKGVIWAFKQKGFDVNYGLDICIKGNIPTGSGLSSSASIEILTGFILRDLFGFDMTNVDLAKIGQFSENKYNRVKCGIMDQFAIAMGKKDNAIFLDTATLNYEYAPVKLANQKIIIANTNKPRGLTDSKYNERRTECDSALAELKQMVNIKTLGDLDEVTFDKFKGIVGSDTRRKRARHAITENMRTVKAVEALKANDLKTFGELMNASHDSLRDDYEVTGIELDTLVDESRKITGVIGSRMTGAGFGGCTVSIVENGAVDEFVEKVGKAYKEKVGLEAAFYVVEIGDGPCIL